MPIAHSQPPSWHPRRRASTSAVCRARGTAAQTTAVATKSIGPPRRGRRCGAAARRRTRLPTVRRAMRCVAAHAHEPCGQPCARSSAVQRAVRARTRLRACPQRLPSSSAIVGLDAQRLRWLGSHDSKDLHATALPRPAAHAHTAVARTAPSTRALDYASACRVWLDPWSHRNCGACEERESAWALEMRMGSFVASVRASVRAAAYPCPEHRKRDPRIDHARVH